MIIKELDENTVIIGHQSHKMSDALEFCREITRLHKEANEPGLAAVLGGLGWIAGLAGLWMLVLARKKGSSCCSDGSGQSLDQSPEQDNDSK